MDKDALTAGVIQGLAAHRNRSTIIQMVCEASGMNWQQAEQFVAGVEKNNDQEIGTRQMPLLVFMGAGIILGGIGLLVWTVNETLNGFNLVILGLPFPYSGNLMLVLMSLTLIAGGAIGIYQAAGRSR